MRCAKSATRVALIGLALSVGPAKAPAQTFFQKLFGMAFGSSAKSEGGDAGASRPVPSLGTFSRTSPYGSPDYRSYPDQDYSDYDEDGAYRTLCVRMCDGFYWPVSSRASRQRFYGDARRCEESCDGEARLFYLPRSSDDIAGMVDLQGRTYGRLPMAFAYRKALVNGCTCKPMPWSASELARHAHYGLVERLERERTEAAERQAAAPEAQHDAVAKTEAVAAVETPMVVAELPSEVSAYTGLPVASATPSPAAVAHEETSAEDGAEMPVLGSHAVPGFATVALLTVPGDKSVSRQSPRARGIRTASQQPAGLSSFFGLFWGPAKPVRRH